MSAAAVLDAVRALDPAIREVAAECERARRLPPPLVGDLARAGVFRLCVPRALGGLEAEPAVTLEVLETLGRADGSTGWCAMIGTTTGLVSAYLDDRIAREIYADPLGVTGGVFAPSGTADPVAGGHRVSGRWRFASGCQHCGWLMGGAILRDGGPPRARMFLFPAHDVEIIDTWDVAGMRGTGSHDIAVRECFVPEGRSVSLTDDRPRADGRLYAFPLFGLLAVGVAAVALGVARRAIDELTTLAAAKVPTGMRRRLADRAMVQVAVAECEADLGAARTFLHAAVGEAWAGARHEGSLSLALRAKLRLAATHATTAAARVTTRMYEAGGGTAIYADSPLQRCFRDVHVVTQHVMVASPTWELCGRMLLGIEADTSML